MSSRCRNRRGSAVGLFPAVRAMFAGGFLFTADRFTVDGVSGKVATLVDWTDSSHTLSQGTSSAQCDLPAADTAFGGRLSLTFAGAQYYDSNRTTDQNKWFHDGTGMTVAYASLATSVAASAGCWSTRAGGSAGASMTRTTTAHVMNIQNPTVVIATNSGGTPQTSTPVVRSMSYSESASPEWTHRLGDTLLGSGSTTAAPEPTASTSTVLRLGATGNLSVYERARVVVFAGVPRVWTDAERAIFHAWVLSRYGVAA